jgi:hypothetical protein
MLGNKALVEAAVEEMILQASTGMDHTMHTASSPAQERLCLNLDLSLL